MLVDLYFENEGDFSAIINAHEISSNISEILTKKIKDEMEGMCINDGYIKPGSVRLISKSMGKLITSHFKGDILYKLKYVASVCNPVEGDIITATVKNINKMGILAYGGTGEEDISPLNILLAVQHHQENEDFKKLQEKDSIYVKVIGKRFEYGDNQISIIGQLVEKPDNIVKEDKQKSENSNNIYYFNHSKEYKWLSNFNMANSFKYKSRIYPTLEHAIQSAKVDDDDYKDLFTLDTETYIGELPNLAKKTGTKTNIKKMKKKIISNWDEIKENIMEEIMKEYYFSNTELIEKLKKTGKNKLIYRGVGVDSYWGVSKENKGMNIHGTILMKLRDSI